MNNRIDARMEFSFRGETLAPAGRFDLDALMQAEGDLPDFHRLLAKANAIDTYSYLYEAMEVCEIHFANATGLAARCVDQGRFDSARFRTLWREEQEWSGLRDIAERHLQISDLDASPALKAALLEAYELGRSEA